MRYFQHTHRFTAPRQSAPGVPAAKTPALFAILAAATFGASCIDSAVPLAPQCTAAIAIELSSEEIRVGDTFLATAIHRGDECLRNLGWTSSGVISFRSAEGHSATFRADASGSGTIRVINDNGNLGVIEVAVEESEEQGARRSD